MAKNETFGWLALYGIQRHQFNFEDIDITDKLMLQGQINARRKEWHELILILDEVQGKLVAVSVEINNIVKELTENAVKNGTRLNQELSTNDEYIQLEAEQKALTVGVSLINGQIDYCKNDLRILNSVFYAKF